MSPSDGGPAPPADAPEGLRILFYTQYFGVGGSTSLLLHVASHLARRHTVAFALPASVRPPGRRLLERHPRLTALPRDDVRPADWDVVVCHLPSRIEEILFAPGPRKVAVSVEIVDDWPVPIRDRHARRLDAFVHLHDEQAAHFDPAFRRRRCHRLPIVNDVDFEPPTATSGCLGAVGNPHKLDPGRLLRILGRTGRARALHLWTDRSRLRWGTRHHLPALAHRARGRLAVHDLAYDLRPVFASFDCLLHLPDRGNGTSMVVSDALACGRRVVLSDLEGFRDRYGDQEGVYFLDDVGPDLSSLVASYDEGVQRSIRAAYARVYDRDDALHRWEEVIVG